MHFVGFSQFTLNILFLSSWGVIGRERDSGVDSGMHKFFTLAGCFSVG